MKLMGGNVRLLVADEPTSALDPEGEYELFTRLRQHSGGKTVIFELALTRLLKKFIDGSQKMVYLAPTKVVAIDGHSFPRISIADFQ